jgi:predicted component of type VI protein secretion system
MKKIITPLFLAGLLFQGCAQSSESTKQTKVIQPKTEIHFELADFLKENTFLDKEVERVFKQMDDNYASSWTSRSNKSDH